MEWSNERILEFIQIYESEPILWDSQDPDHKKKYLNYDAWVRIKVNLNWPVTVEELKAKMKSLMACYRAHLNKYKKSWKSGAGKDDIYKTNWFAFSAMNSFLSHVYECKPTISTSQVSEEYETQEIIETGDSITKERPKLIVKKPRKENLPPELVEAKKQMQAAFENIKTSMNDEYEMFGKLIANKIKNFKDHNMREIVMNDINNLIFRAGMIDRLGQTTPSHQSTYQSPHHQTYMPSPSQSTYESPHHQTYMPSPSQSTYESPHHQTYMPSPSQSTYESPHHQTYMPSPSQSTYQSPHHQTYLPSPNRSTSLSPHHQTYMPYPNPSTSRSPHHHEYSVNSDESFFQSTQQTCIIPPTKASHIIITEAGQIQVVDENSTIN